MADSTATPASDNQDPAAKSDKRPTMEVKVYAPFQVYFEGEAYSVSAENATGPFDVLPRHYNFLCMLIPCDLVIDSPRGKKTIKTSRALMHVKSERVVVFMGV